jgi:hypothetical protein
MKIGTGAVTGPDSGTTDMESIVAAVEMQIPLQSVRWTAEAARLFALDCALVTMRRLLPWLSDAEATMIGIRLNEARRLAVSDRDVELGFVSDELIGMLGSTTTRRSRQVWLVALEALLPDPHRAARIACESAIEVDRDCGEETHPTIESRLRERFSARLNEAGMATDTIYLPPATAGLVGA